MGVSWLIKGNHKVGPLGQHPLACLGTPTLSPFIPGEMLKGSVFFVTYPTLLEKVYGL